MHAPVVWSPLAVRVARPTIVMAIALGSARPAAARCDPRDAALSRDAGYDRPPSGSYPPSGDGANVAQARWNGGDNQRWWIERAGNGA
jgi:hypothetical protein